jgi:hypothetical protein
MAVEIRVFLAVDAFRQKSGTLQLTVRQACFRARQVPLHRNFATILSSMRFPEEAPRRLSDSYRTYRYCIWPASSLVASWRRENSLLLEDTVMTQFHKNRDRASRINAPGDVHPKAEGRSEVEREARLRPRFG